MIFIGNEESGSKVNPDGYWDLIGVPESLKEFTFLNLDDEKLKREKVEHAFKVEIFSEISEFDINCVSMETDAFGDF